MENNVSQRTTIDKALRVNLDERKYGAIAEIGAGQEVARQFFLAGAAAGTIAKTISAYDMQFSDAIYGVQEGGRYVSRNRVEAMLEKEFRLVVDRVGDSRPVNSRFFSYAATVSAKSFRGKNECHAWCGIRVQMYPGAEPSEIVAHVRMRDSSAEAQQEALGVFGVNLVYGGFYYYEDPKMLVDSLTDNLAASRLEIDSIYFRGPFFEETEDRTINLHLIRSKKTHAIMIRPDGSVAVPAEVLYKKNVLTIRGSFKPVTKLNVDMINQGQLAFSELPDVDDSNTIVLAEISLNDWLGNNLNATESDLTMRIKLLNSLGYSVMVSDYTRYFSLRAYFRQYTDRQIGIVLGMINMRQIFDEERYDNVEGGILEAFGKLFPDNTRLYVYPELNESGGLTDLSTLDVADNLQHLFSHLMDNNFICSIDTSNSELLKIYSRDILFQLPQGEGDWEHDVPVDVASAIADERLFGFKKAA